MRYKNDGREWIIDGALAVFCALGLFWAAGFMADAISNAFVNTFSGLWNHADTWIRNGLRGTSSNGQDWLTTGSGLDLGIDDEPFWSMDNAKRFVAIIGTGLAIWLMMPWSRWHKVGEAIWIILIGLISLIIFWISLARSERRQIVPVEIIETDDGPFVILFLAVIILGGIFH